MKKKEANNRGNKEEDNHVAMNHHPNQPKLMNQHLLAANTAKPYGYAMIYSPLGPNMKFRAFLGPQAPRTIT